MMSPQELWAARTGFFTEPTMTAQAVINRANAMLGNVQRASSISNTSYNIEAVQVLLALISEVSSTLTPPLNHGKDDVNNAPTPHISSEESSVRSFSNK